MNVAHGIDWDAPWTVLACRVLFRERAEARRQRDTYIAAALGRAS